MNYQEFEINLKNKLISGTGPKMLMKILDAPFRYDSLLTPFNLNLKMEQGFLRSQENKYYSFIKELCNYFFLNNQFDSLENKYTFIKKEENSETKELVFTEIKINFDYVYAKNNEIIVIRQKKRDIFSKKEILKIVDKFFNDLENFAQNNSEVKIKGYLWFVDNEYQRNFDILQEKFKFGLKNNYEAFFAYSTNLFAYLNNEDYWLEVERNLEKFKKNNYDDFLKLPNLDSDKETLEFMTKMSNKLWEKLTSPEEIYMKIRSLIFNLENSESNFFKAIKLREIANQASDQDELKNKLIEYDQSENNYEK
ncbi:HpyAIV family type II restriction enzyme [Mycoplasmopsis gallinarum]